MKQFLKIICVAICVVILGVTLCSCQYLDDKKAEHAVYTDNSKQAFTFRGYTYRQADVDSNISMLMEDHINTAYVTAEEVPVLIADNFGEELYYNFDEENPIVMECFSVDVYYAYPTGLSANLHNLRTDYFQDDSAMKDRFYIREDRYDQVNETIKNAKLDYYYICVTDYKNIDFDPDYYDYDYYSDPRTLEVIDESYAKAIKESLKDGKKINYSDIKKDEVSVIDFGVCDKDAIFTNNYGVMLLQDENDYYVVQLNSGMPISNDLVKVPDQYKDVIIELYRKYYEEEYEANLTDIFYEYDEYAE